MSALSSLALLWNGFLCLAYGVLFCVDPSPLFEVFYQQPIPASTILTSICRYFGAAQLVYSFLFFHYIPFVEKHGPGLRLGMMLSVAYLMVAGYKLIAEDPDASTKTAIFLTFGIQGFTFVLSFVGFKTVPKEEKRNKSRAKIN